ncbi:MAG: hypothetical protein J6W11_04345 [Alphaproteobacteria bacterium]|nr:hypothetical protein [Alphaproteobacteria bacterium]
MPEDKVDNQEESDVNAKILNELENIDLEPVSVEDSSESDDEFEKLLNSFISSEKGDTVGEQPEERLSSLAGQSAQSFGTAVKYGNDEAELAQAYKNFIDAVSAIADQRSIDLPELVFVPENMVPNYKPSLGRRVVADTLACWDVLFAAFPEKLSTLNPNSSDEQFLNFAEGLSDQNLQLAIISYVEILIDIENCEIGYEERRLKAQRKRIERVLYEEYQKRCERKERFIKAIAERDFPINAERLINNYFKTASKDAKGAYEVLVNNPAMYAPIENDKIKPRLFGLIKVTPEDGIRENYRIGAYLKKLKA